MTAIFQVGVNGNGTVYYNKTDDEIADLVREYKSHDWQVTYKGVNADGTQVIYQLD